MQIHSNIRVTGAALKRWFFAQCVDSLLVAAMWLIGLLILDVPWAPFWAVLAFGLQFIPQLGGPLALIGPMLATLIDGHGWYGALYLLFLYAIVMVVDGLVLQPVLMRRAVKVPIWASIVVPIVMGFFFQFWGVLLSAPLLAVFYTLRAHRKEQKRIEIIPPAEGPPRRTHDDRPPVIEG